MQGKKCDSLIEQVFEFFKTLGVIFCKHKPSEGGGYFCHCFQYSNFEEIRMEAWGRKKLL